MRRRASLGLGATVAIGLVAGSIGGTVAGFTATTENDGNAVSSAPDFRAPDVTAVAVGKGEGGASGFVREGGSYYVYADVAADSGNPPSGIASVTADVGQLTAGSSAVSLTAGSYSAGGVSYDYRSAELTADGALPEGSTGFSVTATDVASNADSEPGSVVVDDTAPQAEDVQTANAGGGTPGLPEQGDTVALSFSEPVEPDSVIAGWTGAATPVLVRIYDGGAGSDVLRVFDAAGTGELPLGTVLLGGADYVTGDPGGYVELGGAGGDSTMAAAGDGISIELGAYQAPGVAVRATAAGAGTAEWTPSTAATDRAGNAVAGAAALESGPSDVEL